MPQTWDGVVVAKADQPDTPDPDWLLAIADKAKPAVKAAFLEALRRVRDAVKDAELRDAVARGDVQGALRALGVDRELTTALKPGMTRPLEDAFISAGRQAPARTMGVHLGMRFDLTNPHAAKFLRDYDFGLIKQISADTREGIRQVILNAFEWGGHPYEQARTIKESIGLTDTQAAAVDNFRTMLVNRDRQALTRALRDRRHDRTLNGALGANPDRTLSGEQIDVQVARYRNRALVLRAETIARTETMRASNAAMRLAWGQAQSNGLLPGNNSLRRFWLVTDDDRLCPYCEAVPELNPHGVALDALFETSRGPVLEPPLHPNCRCITFIDAGNKAMENTDEAQDV